MVIVAQKKIDEGRFTRARRTDDADDLPGLNAQIDVIQHLLRTVKGEVHVLKFNRPTDVGIRISLSEVVLGLGVENVEDALDRCHRVLGRIGQIREEVDRPVEHRRIGDKGNEQTDRDRGTGTAHETVNDEIAAKRPDDHTATAHHTVDDRGIGVQDLSRMRVGLTPFLHAVPKHPDRFLLIREGLDDTDAGERVGKHRCHRR